MSDPRDLELIELRMQLVHARRQLAVQRAHWENEVQRLTHARDFRMKVLHAKVLAFVLNKMHRPWIRQLDAELTAFLGGR